MDKIYYFKEDVRIVTGYYYDIILNATELNGFERVEFDSYRDPRIKDVPKDAWMLTTSVKEFFFLYMKGFRHFVHWFQGIVPEEDYWRTHSRLRRFAFSALERLAWTKSAYRICVSKYQVEHYEKKYGKVADGTCYVMPCFNSEFYKEHFHVAGKYDKNVFCYAGGVQTYQGFDAILRTYKAIETRYGDTFLRIYTFDREKAKQMIEAEGIKNYSLGCVPQKEVPGVLAQCKYGFIIRDNNIVNQVATPTKLCDYLGNGVIPIFTSTIRAYADIASHYEHLYCFDESDKEQVIDAAMSASVDANELENEYRSVMQQYFNPEQFRQQLSVFLKGMTL